MMARLLIGLGLVLGLALAALIVGPRFVDWTRYKDDIAAQARAATGRTLTIDGGISLSILPTPTLAVGEVRFANLEGASTAEMATLDRLELRVALLPLLLQGRVQVQSLALVRPTIVLERLEDGRQNWLLRRPPGSPRQGGAARELDIRLDSITVEDGTLVYRDQVAGTEERLDAVEAEIAAQTLSGPFRAAGAATLRGLPVTFEASLGRLQEGRPAPLSLAFGVPRAEANLAFAGSASLQPQPARATGRLTASGPSLARLLHAAGREAALPDLLDQPFELDGELAVTGLAFELDRLLLALGDMGAKGSLSLAAGTPPRGRLRLALNRLDLHALLAALEPRRAAADGAVAAAGFALPERFAADLDLAVEAMTYRGGVISKARLTASLAAGRVAVTRLSALLPGGSDVAIAGTLAAAGGQPRFDGRIEAASGNLRVLLDWLGEPLAGVPSDRLRTASLTSDLAAMPARLEFSAVDLRLDLSRLAGGVVVALPERGVRARAAFGIGLAIDQVNLDAYLPPPATAPAGQPPPGPAAAVLRVLAPLAPLEASLNLHVGQLLYRDEALEGLQLDATLHKGDLAIRALRAAAAAGLQGSLSGSVEDLAGEPRFDIALDLAAAEGARALALAGLDAMLPPGSGRLALAGELSGTARAFDFDLRGSAAGLALSGSAAGRAAGLEGGAPSVAATLALAAGDGGRLLPLAGLPAAAALGPLALEGELALEAGRTGYRFRLSAPDLAGRAEAEGQAVLAATGWQLASAVDLAVERPAPLLRLAGLGEGAAGAAGPIALAGSVEGTDAGLAVELRLAAFGATGSAAGSLVPPPATGGFDLAVDLAHPDLRRLAVLLGTALEAAAPLPGRLAARAVGNLDEIALNGLAIEAGASRLNGTARIDRRGPRPFLEAALDGNALDLLPFLAAATPEGGAAEPPARAAGRWSSAPLDLSALQALDAELALAAVALRHDDLTLENLAATLALREGVLTVARLEAGLFGGRIAASGTLSSRGIPRLALTLAAEELALERMVRDGLLSGRLAGPVSLALDLQGSGASMAGLIGSLQGGGRLSGRPALRPAAEGEAGTLLLDLLGPRLGEIRGVTDRVNAVLAAFTGAPNALGGRFRVNRGVVRTEDLLLAGRGATARGTGEASLVGWQIDAEIAVHDAEGRGDPLLILGLGGALDRPDLRLSGPALATAAPVQQGLGALLPPIPHQFPSQTQ